MVRNGAGSSIRNDLGQSPAGPTEVRAQDITVEVYDKNQGCAWEETRGGVSHQCSGPPDWKYNHRWWCLAHIDQKLCCGSRLSNSQRRSILTNPKRNHWLARQRQLAGKEQTTADEFENQFPSTINDPQEHTFSWREYQARQ